MNIIHGNIIHEYYYMEVLYMDIIRGNIIHGYHTWISDYIRKYTAVILRSKITRNVQKVNSVFPLEITWYFMPMVRKSCVSSTRS